MDEIWLFWKGVQNRNLVLQREKSKASKLAWERLTIALFCLANGEKF
jgi:hypothetical protein